MKQKILVLVMLLYLISDAQQKPKIQFCSVNQVGLLSGSSTVSWQWQSVNGVSYKTYSLALGLGIDHYYMKSLPVFIDVRKNIFNSPQTPFVYVDLGSNVPLKKKETLNGWQTSEYSKGFYFDAGVGYSWKLKGELAFLISAGYSEKDLHETRTNVLIVENNYPEHYDYAFRRLSIKTGLRF